jgi:hypothetical protein
MFIYRAIKLAVSRLSTLKSIESGVLNTLEYRMHFNKNGSMVSPWHDIPLKDDEHYNFIVEVR